MAAWFKCIKKLGNSIWPVFFFFSLELCGFSFINMVKGSVNLSNPERPITDGFSTVQ